MGIRCSQRLVAADVIRSSLRQISSLFSPPCQVLLLLEISLNFAIIFQLLLYITPQPHLTTTAILTEAPKELTSLF